MIGYEKLLLLFWLQYYEYAKLLLLWLEYDHNCETFLNSSNLSLLNRIARARGL